MADSLSNSLEDVDDSDICEHSFERCDAWKICSCCEHSVGLMVMATLDQSFDVHVVLNCCELHNL